MLGLSADRVSLIVTLVFLFVILTAAPLCGLARRRHKLVPALILLGVTIASVVIAAFVCRALIKVSGNVLFDLIDSLMDEEMADWLALMPTGENTIRAVLGVITAFVLFLPVFILVYLLARVIAGVLIRVIGGKRDGKRHLAGFLVGLGNGMVLGLILLIPLCILITGAADTALTFFGTGAGEAASVREALDDVKPEDIEAYAVKLSENGTVKVVDVIAARPVEAIIGHADIAVPSADAAEKTVRFDLKDCVNGLADMAGRSLIAVDGLQTYTETHVLTDEHKASVNDAMDSMFKFEWLAQSGAELVSSVSSCWLEEKPCLTLQYPEINEMLVPTVKVALKVLSDETGETLKADINTVKELLFLLCDNNLLLDDQTYDSVMEKVWGGSLINELLAVIGRNDHLEPLTEEFKSLGFRVISHVLSIEELESGKYDEALDEISPVLQKMLGKTPEEREPEIRSAVQNAFEKYNINVPDDLAVSLAEEVISTYGSDGDITSKELLDFFTSHYDAVTEVIGDNPDIKIPDEIPIP